MFSSVFHPAYNTVSRKTALGFFLTSEYSWNMNIRTWNRTQVNTDVIQDSSCNLRRLWPLTHIQNLVLSCLMSASGNNKPNVSVLNMFGVPVGWKALKAGLCRRLADAAVITTGQKDGICEAASWGWGRWGNDDAVSHRGRSARICLRRHVGGRARLLPPLTCYGSCAS